MIELEASEKMARVFLINYLIQLVMAIFDSNCKGWGNDMATPQKVNYNNFDVIKCTINIIKANPLSAGEVVQSRDSG
jgi:hypothetical protein